MYPVSELARQIIDSDDRSMEWAGTITLSDGTIRNYDMSNIVQGTCFLRTSCNAPWIGQTVSTELSTQLYIDIDSEKLKNAVISMNCRVLSLIGVQTWGDLLPYTWNDVSGMTWGEENKRLSTRIPMGVFTVQKARRSINSIQLTAYDNMSKFDVEISNITSTARNSYQWLALICRRCGVPLDMTPSDFRDFPNASRNIVFSDSNSVIKTYRDMLSQIAAALCAVAMMGRNGGLVLVPCKSPPVFTYTPDNRFSSEFEDYKTSYTGIYAQYKASGVQEYLTNNEENDTGSIIDLGANPFLQISGETARKSAIQSIIDGFKNYTITPFEMTIPYDPTLDLMDVIQFTGGHAPDNALAPITDFSRTINGNMTLRCDVSETIAGLLRADKTIDGVSGSSAASGISYASSGFWIEIDSFPDNSESISSDTTTTSKDIEFTVDKTKTQIAWTGNYTLSEDATVTAKVYVGEDLIYLVADEQTSGIHLLNVVVGHEVAEKGSKNIRVVLNVSDGTLTMSANSARMTVLGIGYSEYSVDSGDGFSLEEQLVEDLIDSLGFGDLGLDPSEILDGMGADATIDPGDVIKTHDSGKGEEIYRYNPELGVYENIGHIEAPVGAKAKFKNGKVSEYIKEITDKAGVQTSTTDLDMTNYNGVAYYDPSHPLDDPSSEPYAIEVTTKPTKLVYDTGETIDLTGAIIIARTITWSVWTSTFYPDGRVPLNEIMISPILAG